jgi:uncharacterized repeat protein (TIGR03803 family)
MFRLRASLGGWLFVGAAFVAVPIARAQTYTVLHSFSRASDGANPSGTLVQATDGMLYGTTSYGGAGLCFDIGGIPIGCGTTFKMDSSGNLTTLSSFAGTGAEGISPAAGLIQATDGMFYGTTQFGGTVGDGTIFRMDSSGNLTTLHNFEGTDSDGNTPVAGLIQATDGNLYGTTQYGGNGADCAGGCGTVFKMDPSGNVTTLHSFTGSDGSSPMGALIQARDGNFYGTTARGGTGSLCQDSCGTVFKMDSSGNLTTLHSFAGSDGSMPLAGLIQALDGNFYGTTGAGGGGACSDGCGTAFRIDRSGNFATLHDFSGTGTSGANPFAGLLQAPDGTFFGTTYSGAGGGCTGGCGTIYTMSSSGQVTTLHSFTRFQSDGVFPVASLFRAANGKIYGSTLRGGTNGDGVVFTLLANLVCPTNAETLCLNQGRFIVNASWTDFQGNSGLASVVPGANSNDSGIMWFFGPDNWELLIKVLNGCGVNGNYWVFGAAATDVGYTIQVTDTQTGEVRTYTNPLGTTSPAITDTAAFENCP